MTRYLLRRVMGALLITVMLSSVFVPGIAGQEATAPVSDPESNPLDKLSASLKDMATTGGDEAVNVTVIATGSIAAPDTYLSAWSDRDLLDYTIYGGTISTGDLLSLASDPAVAHIQLFKPHEVPDPLGTAAEKGITADPEAALQEALAKVAEEAAARAAARAAALGLDLPDATADVTAPADWWGGQDVHGGDAANAAGYTGDGVKVAMVDSGVDFGHPDLNGQYAVYPEGHTYAGWPIALDPMSMRNYYYNGMTWPDGSDYSWYANTTSYVDVETAQDDPSTVITTTFEVPIVGRAKEPDRDTRYWVTPEIAASSKSGRLRYGTHPDASLMDIYSAQPAVLLVDTEEAYVYDTVYVDLNGDRWFNADAGFDPTGDGVTTNNVDVPATKTSPVITVDDVWTTVAAYTVTATITEPVYTGGWAGSGGMGPRLGSTMLTETTTVDAGTLIWEPDGKPDLSAGMITYIADGVTPIPGSDMLGYGAPFPAASYDPPLADATADGLIPQNGGMVAFMLGTAYAPSGGDHGTGCSTMVAAKGVIDYPAFSGESLATGQVQFPLAEGNTLQGLAPESKIIAVGNNYATVNGMQGFWDAYQFIALGADGVPDTGDEAQVANFSFGDNSVFNDGWDLESRYLTYLSEHINPTLAMAAATGNDGPGYGTIDAPASSPGTIAVGASTSYGATSLTNWGIPSADYINSADVVYFSNRGPSALGGAPDVMAIGFVNHVALPVNANTDYDGNTALSVGGGTSYAAPFVAGVLADIYQAFNATWGRWPTAAEAKEILMAGADDMNTDPFSQGAGNVRADAAAMIAAGDGGLFTSPSTWRAGDYGGVEYDAFAKLVPGGSATTTFTVKNTGDTAETATLSDEMLTLTETRVYTIETTGYGEDQDAVWAYGHPDYFLPITPALAATALITDPTTMLSSGLYTYTTHGSDMIVDVPEGAELMRVHLNQDWADYSTFSNLDALPPEIEYVTDNNWDIAVYEWDDLNENGWFWADPHADPDTWAPTDAGDDVFNPLYTWVDIVDKGSVYSHLMPVDIFATDGESELSLVNFTVSTDAPGNTIDVHDPGSRGAADSTTDKGLVIGLSHWYDWYLYNNYGYYGPQVLTVTVEFYDATDWGWLETSAASVAVPAATSVPAAAAAAPGEATFEATVTVPDGTEPGLYEGAVLVNDQVVPVVVNVSAEMGETYHTTFGTVAEMTPYRNGAMLSANQIWGGGIGNGDWRFYAFDLADTGDLSDNAMLYYKNAWGTCTDTDPDPAVEAWACSNTPGDINPYLFGPNISDDYSMVDPATFGPHGQSTLYGGGYPDYDGNYIGYTGGDWAFGTSSDGPIDEFCLAQPDGWREGLYEVVLHTGLFGGAAAQMPFSGEIGFLSLTPDFVNETVDATSGTVPMTLIAPWDQVKVEAVGLNTPMSFNNQTVAAGIDREGDPVPSDLMGGWIYDFEAKNNDGVVVTTSQGAFGWLDLDLYLLYDANGDGAFNVYDNREVVASERGSTGPSESLDTFPGVLPDGDYRVVVYGAADTDAQDTFNVQITLYGGDGLTILEADADGIVQTTPGVPMDLSLAYDLAGYGEWSGYVSVTPVDTEACGSLWVPVQLNYGLVTSVEAAPGYLVRAGQKIDYTLTVQNYTGATVDTDITAALPANTEYALDSLKYSGNSYNLPWYMYTPPWFNTNAQRVEWSGDIAAGDTLTITYQVNVLPQTAPGTDLVNRVDFGTGMAPMSVSNRVAYPYYLPITFR